MCFACIPAASEGASLFSSDGISQPAAPSLMRNDRMDDSTTYFLAVFGDETSLDFLESISTRSVAKASLSWDGGTVPEFHSAAIVFTDASPLLSPLLVGLYSSSFVACSLATTMEMGRLICKQRILIGEHGHRYEVVINIKSPTEFADLNSLVYP
jgi:hypothetical protein